jgi:hypothetical protein
MIGNGNRNPDYRKRRNPPVSIDCAMVSLEIYVDEGCLGCRRSLELAAHVRSRFPDVDVKVYDASEPAGNSRHLVLATPTFILNGKKMSLGNPSPAQLDEAILSAMNGPRA